LFVISVIILSFRITFFNVLISYFLALVILFSTIIRSLGLLRLFVLVYFLILLVIRFLLLTILGLSLLPSALIFIQFLLLLNLLVAILLRIVFNLDIIFSILTIYFSHKIIHYFRCILLFLGPFSLFRFSYYHIFGLFLRLKISSMIISNRRKLV